MKSRAALLLAASCAQLGWSDIHITLVDSRNAPIQGVSCTQIGGSTAVSDRAGSLTLSSSGSAIAPRSGEAASPSLSRISLGPGEKAVVTVMDLRGRRVLRRSIAAGERFEFARGGNGVYFVDVSGSSYSARGRMAGLGRGLVFEGFGKAKPSAPALAKSGPGGVAVICSKEGFASQSYVLQPGSRNTLDFTEAALVPLYDALTRIEPETVIETDTAIITRFSDRARDRHAREDQYKTYDHYLAHYWEFRTATIQITDYIAKGGDRIRIDQWTLWPLDSAAREFRAFYRGIGTVAEYHHNASMTVDPADPLHYFTELSHNGQAGRAARIGDRMEIEVSQFLSKTGLDGQQLVGRDNYYGTTYLYIIGQGGLVPWHAKGVFGDASTEREDSYPLPQEAWLGGRTTIHQQYTDEPDDVFMQMATNTAPQNGQVFMNGRRVLHTSFVDGSHDEPDNPVWEAHAGKAGPNFINISCSACHHKNGRALSPSAGTALDKYVFKVGDAQGKPHPKLGSVLQPKGGNEGLVRIAGWAEADGLRKPAYGFEGVTPGSFSARISPQLVGMGLLEAVPEGAVQALADPEDENKDGISGRMRIVKDHAGRSRLGRFGWKAGQPDLIHQVAAALNTDIGVTTSIFPRPDCGSEQTGCGGDGPELADEHLEDLVDYVRLLGVRAQRNSQDADVKEGKAIFSAIGCAACHVPSLKTGPYHPKAELRNQTIHPYTDLLLHDMGPGLADNMPEGDAGGTEWRTAPLWNIGLTAGPSGGEGYLHDGRARTLAEAILWHGGEAQPSADRFKALSQYDKDALLGFLKSL